MSAKSRERREKFQKLQEAREIEGLVKKERFWDRFLRWYYSDKNNRMEWQPFDENDWEGDGYEEPVSQVYLYPLCSWDIGPYNYSAVPVIDATPLFYPLLMQESKAAAESFDALNGRFDIRLPFDTVCVEIKSPMFERAYHDEPEPFEHVAILMGHGADNEDYDPDRYEDIFISVIGYEGGENYIDFGAAHAYRENGHMCFEGGKLVIAAYDDEGFRLRQAIQMAFLTVELLQRKNLILVDDPPNPVDTVKHEHHFGVPLVKYKQLAIKTSTKQRDECGKIITHTEVMPLHGVRGHIRHSMNHPIPQFRGIFTVRPHVRGSEKNGIVVKDYKVKP